MSSKVIKLTWAEVAEMVRTELRKIIGKDVFCMAKSDDDTYWDISFPLERLPLSDCTVSLKLLMQRIVARFVASTGGGSCRQRQFTQYDCEPTPTSQESRV